MRKNLKRAVAMFSFLAVGFYAVIYVVLAELFVLSLCKFLQFLNAIEMHSSFKSMSFSKAVIFLLLHGQLNQYMHC